MLDPRRLQRPVARALTLATALAMGWLLCQVGYYQVPLGAEVDLAPGTRCLYDRWFRPESLAPGDYVVYGDGAGGLRLGRLAGRDGDSVILRGASPLELPVGEVRGRVAAIFERR
ncbi:MAG: hypothetical protein HY722_03840 [Planctomycetes bacterium]|nr:hypothetical protein [Planctomycetota bacterium]